MKIIEDISYGENKNNILDVFLPDRESSPVFIHLHGGGLESGTHRDGYVIGIAKTLAEMGVTVVNAEYRMYPEAKFPEFIEDGAAIVNWVIRNIGNYIKPEGIYVGGTSAGGYITQMLCFNSKYLSAYGLSNDDISGYYHNSGQPTTHFNVLRERGMDTLRVVVDDAAPMYHIDGTGQYPAMRFLVADNDLPNRYEQTMLIDAVLRNYGYDMNNIEVKVMENSEHCAYIEDVDDNGRYTFALDIYDFIDRCRNKM